MKIDFSESKYVYLNRFSLLIPKMFSNFNVLLSALLAIVFYFSGQTICLLYMSVYLK